MLKNIFNRLKTSTLVFFLCLFSFYGDVLWGQIPANYYSAAEGKSGRELQAALSGIIRPHTILIYGGDYPGGLWHAFRTTDIRPDGYVWDIYSNCNFIPWEDGHISGSGECTGGTQQEHTFCQSWMGYSETPLMSDIFHIYPVDGWVNGRRNNNPYGEVPDDEDWTTRWFENGARLGYNYFVGENMTSNCGIAYEPVDQYKGDIARGFFYIATCYMFEDEDFADSYAMTVRSQLRPWATDMMLKWSRNDTVSSKEINRNNIIYSDFQHNRNPYIDYPELAELVFGEDSVQAVFTPRLVRAPQDFSISPDTAGRLRATLTWRNPTSDISNQTVTLTAIIIQRNGNTVHTISNPAAGEWQTWVDNTIPANRKYEYRIFAVTEAGNGLAAKAKAFIGQYCPVTVEMFDVYSDGWDGNAHIEFQDEESNLLAFSKLPCGEGWLNVFELQLPPETIHCVWIPGSADGQNSFKIYDHELNELYTATTADVTQFNGTFFTFENTGCPLTPIPEETCYQYDTLSICETELPFYYAPGDTIFDEETHSLGRYEFTLPSSSGCDSILSLTLSVNSLSETYEEITICEQDLPYYYEYADTTFGIGTESDIYEFQFVNGRCNRLHNLFLIINECEEPDGREVLASWTFDELYDNGTFGTNGARTITANYGVKHDESVLLFNGSCGASNWTYDLEVQEDWGAYLGDPRGDSAIYGNALSALGYYNNGKKMVLKFPTIGYRAIELQYAVRATSSGMRQYVWEWSLDGQNYFPASDTITEERVGYYVLQNIDLQNVEPIEWRDSIFLRITLDGGTYWNGSARFDNITITGLPFHPQRPDTTFLDSVVCDYDFPIVWNNTLFENSSQKTATLLSRYQLDSVIVMRVIEQENDIYETQYVTPNQLPYEWYGKTFYEAGSDTVRQLSFGGCIITMHLELIVREVDISFLEQTICQDELPFHWYDVTFNDAGTDTLHLTNHYGTDSLVVIRLNVLPSYVIHDTIVIAETEFPYYYPLADTMFLSGTELPLQVTFRRMTTDGCDSILILHLLSNETNGVTIPMDNFVSVFPNPVSKTLIISTKETFSHYCEIRLIEASGKILSDFWMKNPTEKIEMSRFSAGIYFLEIIHKEGKNVDKMLIKVVKN